MYLFSGFEKKKMDKETTKSKENNNNNKIEDGNDLTYEQAPSEGGKKLG